MSFFKKINMHDLESRMHLLDQSSDQEVSDTVELNSKQQEFLKRYLKFQAFFIKKVQKDNKMTDGYLIIVPTKGSGNDDIYLVLTPKNLYMVRNDVNTFKFRLTSHMLRLDVARYPSPAFLPSGVKTYQAFFRQLFSVFRRMLDFPSQFVISTKEGSQLSSVEDAIQYAQIDKYL